MRGSKFSPNWGCQDGRTFLLKIHLFVVSPEMTVVHVLAGARLAVTAFANLGLMRIDPVAALRMSSFVRHILLLADAGLAVTALLGNTGFALSLRMLLFLGLLFGIASFSRLRIGRLIALVPGLNCQSFPS